MRGRCAETPMQTLLMKPNTPDKKVSLELIYHEEVDKVRQYTDIQWTSNMLQKLIVACTRNVCRAPWLTSFVLFQQTLFH